MKKMGLLVFFFMLIGAYVCEGNIILVTEKAESLRIGEYGLLKPIVAGKGSKDDKTVYVHERQDIASFDGNPSAYYDADTMWVWSLNPSDDYQSARFRFASQDYANNPTGFSLKTRYDVDARGRAVNGVWLKLPLLDIGAFDYISFWVKGDEKLGFTTYMSIGFWNDKAERMEFGIGNITAEWQNYVIDLKQMKDANQWKVLKALYTIFDSEGATAKRGGMYIDQIEFISVVR